MKSFRDLKAQFNPEPSMEIRILTPDECQVCGMKTMEWMDEHGNNPDHGWLMVQLPNTPGVAILGCPKCSSLYFNPNAKENIRMINEFQEEEKNRRIAVASGIIDPAGRPIGLKAV
jgi:hypothetical protein